MESQTSGPDAISVLDGWSLRASSGVDAAALVRPILALLPRIAAAFDTRSLAAALPDRTEVYRWRPWRSAFLLPAPAGSSDAVHVKIYRSSVLAPSRGATSWRMGRALLAAGLRTPEPWLLAEKRSVAARTTLLITRPLLSPRLLTDEIKRRLAAGESVRPLLAEVAILAAAFHDAGFFHGDFTASNVLVAGDPPARELWIIDLDRARHVGALPSPARLWVQCLDLRLLLLTTWGEVSRREWIRLLARYLRARKIARPLRKRMARRVLAAKRGRMRLGATTGTIGGRDPWRRT